MKKTKIIVILMGFVIIIQSFGIYKLIKQPASIITKNVVASSSPQIIYKDRIIYKDKIVYQNDAITKKILFQTSLFLYLTPDKKSEYQCSYEDNARKDLGYGLGMGVEQRFIDGTEVISPDIILKAITKYNKDNLKE